MMRPQFGSLPAMAVLTSGEFEIERAMRSASLAVRAPRTSMVTSLLAPSPSLAIIFASVWLSSVSPAKKCCPNLFPGRAATPARPLASAITESFVEVSPSTVMRLKETSTAARSIFASNLGGSVTSVVMKQSMVAMRGWIIPAPLVTPARWTAFPSISDRSTQDFGNVSVVMIARGTGGGLWAESFSLGAGSWLKRSSDLRGTPMPPAEATRTCWAGPRSSFAAARAVSSAVRRPTRPVQALALPELTTTARARPPLAWRFFRQRMTGAAAARLVVNVPAAEVSRASETSRARSSDPSTFLIPAATAAPRKPAGVARFPSIRSQAGMDEFQVEARRSSRPLRPGESAWAARRGRCNFLDPARRSRRRLRAGDFKRAQAGLASLQEKRLVFSAGRAFRHDDPLGRDHASGEGHGAVFELPDQDRVTIVDFGVLETVARDLLVNSLRFPLGQDLRGKFGRVVEIGLRRDGKRRRHAPELGMGNPQAARKA